MLTKRHFWGLRGVPGTSSAPSNTRRGSVAPGWAALTLRWTLPSQLSSAHTTPTIHHTCAAHAVQQEGETAG